MAAHERPPEAEMLSRVLSVALSLLLFLFTGPLLGFALLKSQAPVRDLALVFGVVNAVVLWVLWKFITRYRRYASKPFQIEQSYRLRLYDWEDTEVGAIAIEGPALLILTSTIPLTKFGLRGLEASEYKHGPKQTEFLVHASGNWSAVLTARAPRPPFLAIQFSHTDSGVLAKITLEVRGDCRIHQLPQGTHELAKGFPVIVKPVDQADSR